VYVLAGTVGLAARLIWRSRLSLRVLTLFTPVTASVKRRRLPLAGPTAFVCVKAV